MAQTLVADELIEQACKSTGLSRFDSASFREGLGILLADFNRNGYSDSSVERLRSQAMMSLSNRLKTTSYLDAHPELKSRPIKRPLFVLGVPRTGTTLLSNLLAADPLHRSPLTCARWARPQGLGLEGGAAGD